ncbi:unnamed protein product [Porites evermanni]|uniref:Metallo-beta-lactamase domain-containing protein n=1 Tax=Porites evermanni TaxID=104178 RepID=A0ABN8R9T6_9CNID|nr:unnamed protein product [Porites evermanni]
MADVGAGVLKPCREKLGTTENKFPRNVFISHNHMDHSGELPMLFAVESKRRHAACEPRLKVLCGPEVEHKLKVHRLDEMLTMYRPEQVADWVVCKQDGDPTYLDEDRDFFITVYRTLHGEVCYGKRKIDWLPRKEGKMGPAILRARDRLLCLSVKNLITMPKYWPGIFQRLLWFSA